MMWQHADQLGWPRLQKMQVVGHASLRTRRGWRYHARARAKPAEMLRSVRRSPREELLGRQHSGPGQSSAVSRHELRHAAFGRHAA